MALIYDARSAGQEKRKAGNLAENKKEYVEKTGKGLLVESETELENGLRDIKILDEWNDFRSSKIIACAKAICGKARRWYD